VAGKKRGPTKQWADACENGGNANSNASAKACGLVPLWDARTNHRCPSIISSPHVKIGGVRRE
jgi:hypothetical protein